MSELLLELCSLVRSKNAGPFELTFDFMCRGEETYRRLCESKMLTPELFARLFHTDERDVLFFEHDAALAVKVSIPRPIIQGALEDTDCYGGQQYALVLDALKENMKS
jgi:hypothetical protein